VGNLPAEVTSFIDRRHEVAEVTRLLSTTRLATLTGVAGVGKTRLALRVADRLQRAFPDGVWLVELAPVQDPALVAHTVANALGVHDSGRGDPRAALLAFLHDRRLLLVLDNCEHVASACAELTHDLLSSIAGLRILATSRQALRATGEHLWTVPPLPVAPVRSAATELFAERAAAVAPSFRLTEHNQAHVVEVCRRLDGIPLAIELAAAGMQGMSLPRLDDRFDLLGRSPHERTLRAAIDWSYALCEPVERALWARLSVFTGGFDLDAAEKICGDGEVVDLLDRLVSKSVVTAEPHAGRIRYRLLDTLRRYGLAKLDDRDGLARRHARYYVELAERAEQEWFGPRQAHWFEWTSLEQDNIRAALEFGCSSDYDIALRFAAALWFHWVFAGRVAEGRLWLDRVLALPVAPNATLARAQATGALLASQQGDLETATDLSNRSREHGDPLTVARAVARLAIIAHYRRDLDTAEGLLSEAIARYEALDLPVSPHVVMVRLTLAAMRQSAGDLEPAAEQCRACAEICRSRGDHTLLANSLTILANIEWLAGSADDAGRHAREALGLRRSRTAVLNMAQLTELLAWITASSGPPADAAVMLGAAWVVWKTFGLEGLLQAPFYAVPHEQCVSRTRAALGPAAYEAAYARGSRLTIDDLVTFALGEPPSPGAATTTELLTEREREVARLIADGLTNRQIADRLVVSPRTVATHIEHIMTKLGVGSRAQIAAWLGHSVVAFPPILDLWSRLCPLLPGYS
jgi:non-specific serine/threonine protein kinase